MTFTWASGTHQGRVRTNNEDHLYPQTSGSSDTRSVFAVADGMGGHVAGEIASSKAIDIAIGTSGSVEERIAAANDAIVDAAEENRRLAGMGTTLTIAELDPNGSVSIGHVGDSRAYLLRTGVLRQLTTDHSVVAEYLAAGKIRPEDVARHPQRSMLTRALGLSRTVEVDVLTEDLQPGDRLLLCTDGLSSMITDDDIAARLADGTPDQAVWSLIEAANAAGGYDNVTVVVVDTRP
ncbi:MAG TPA: serine/threonine-protein phosphatase [Actinobacteria bacterium]|nr:serine/threonine phosphatase stp [bacterium BMS3Bbin01]HDH26486.1 serine/threonine-protein phosphatase [Actinomycetota bacterium]